MSDEKDDKNRRPNANYKQALETNSHDLTSMLKRCKRVLKLVEDLSDDYMESSEWEMKKTLTEKYGEVPQVVTCLRLAFWDEHRRSIMRKQYMVSGALHEGVCSREWYYNWVKDPLILAYVLTPFVDEMLIQREMLEVAYSRLRDVLRQPLNKKRKKLVQGKVVEEEYFDLGLAREVHNIAKTMQNRIHGSVIQQIEQKNLNVNVEKKQEDLLSMEQLELMEKDIQRLKGEVIDVETSEKALTD